MALQLRTVADSIAGISIPGVTLADVDELRESVRERECPLLMPKPGGFVTNLRFEHESFGTGAAAKISVRYTLNYAYFHKPVGQGRLNFADYADLVSNAAAVVDAIIANDALPGAVDVTPGAITAFGPVQDPAGNLFHGFLLAVEVQEFVN